MRLTVRLLDFELASLALKANKHVLLEKPFVPTSAEATELINLARTSKRLISVYQNRRWDSDFLTFLSLRASGVLGRIVEFETHFDRYKGERPSTWKGQLGMANGGGVIYDLGTHLIDQVVFAFGLPSSVTAVFDVSRQDGATDPDAITVLLRYKADGLLVTVKAAVLSIETKQLRFWVRGTKGSYRKYGLDVQEDQLKAGKKPGDAGFGVESKEKAGELTVFQDGKPVTKTQENITPETYRKLYEGFAEAIQKGDEELVPVKATEARDVLRVIEAAKESAKTEKTVQL